MEQFNRRSFIQKTALGIGSTLFFSEIATANYTITASKYKGIPIGFQTFPIRDMLSKDFAGTLRKMAEFGYKTVELCSPVGYEKIGFGFLGKLKCKEINNIIVDSGLTCPSCHFTKVEFSPEKISKTIELAQEMGFSQMICATLGMSKKATLNDYEHEAKSFNIAAEKVKLAGMQAGFHNHDFEFVKIEGQLIYDVLLQHFDPELVKLQFQTQVIQHGYKASDYFKKYPGRFISAHLSDWSADKKEANIGEGIINWKEFFANTETGGIKNIFVEMNFDKFKKSIDNIHKMNVRR